MDRETYLAAIDAAMAPLKAPDPAEAAKDAESAGKVKSKKKKGKRKGKSAAARGETALHKSRGTGFEGLSLFGKLVEPIAESNIDIDQSTTPTLPSPPKSTSTSRSSIPRKCFLS